MEDTNRNLKESEANDEQSAKHALKDLCIYFVFLLVTTIITMSSREIGMFYFNHTIDRLFLQRTTFNQLTFNGLVTVGDWWSFAEATFLDSISQFGLKDNNMTMGGNVLLGLPRFRQIRVQREKCNVDKVFQELFEACYGHYSPRKEEVGEFLNKKHSSQSELSTFTVWGSIKPYQGAGYVEIFTDNKEKNVEILNKLKDQTWIDKATRIVLIEFALYNANVNLFCNAKLLAEIPATGGMITSSRLQSLKYSPLWNEGGFFIPLCSVTLFGLILYYAFEAVRKIRSIGWAFFHSIFNVLDVVIILMVFSALAYIIWHTLYLRSILNRYAENVNQYFSLDIICFWNLVFIDTMGICVFIAWIQVLKYIKFNKTMMQFSTTLQRCGWDLFGFSIMFSIVLIAYACLAVLLFGSLHADFYTFPTAVIALMRTVLGDFDYEKLEAANRVLGPIFFLSYILFVFFILVNMFLAIINDTYTDVKSEITHGGDNKLEIYIKTLLEKLKKYLPLARKKDNDLEEQKQEEPKSARPSLQSNDAPETSPKVQDVPNGDQKPRTRKELIDSLFEIISDDRNMDVDPLAKRVAVLETKLEKLVESLDEILNKIDHSASKPSSRSL